MFKHSVTLIKKAIGERFHIKHKNKTIFLRIKSDRINELRKKYEDFLEEDRKRKERNEYILGKLDKMRECTTVAHQKKYQPDFVEPNYKLPVVLPTPMPVGTPAGHDAQHRRTIHSMALHTTTVNSSVSSILSQIFSKFILIPKALSNSEEKNTEEEKPVVYDSARAQVDNADWKIKYQILNQLKQNEKEEPVREEINNVIDLPVDKKQDLPEKDTPCRDITSTLHDEIAYESYFYPDEKQAEVYGHFTDPALAQGPDPYSTINFDYPIAPVEDQENEMEIRPTCKDLQNKEELPIDIESAIQKIDDDKNDFKKPTEKIKSHEIIEYFDNDGLNPAQISYPNDDVGKPLGDIPQNIEDMQYPKEIIDVEEFTPRSDIPVQDGVNVNPEGYGMNKTHFEALASGDPETTSVSSREQAENQGISNVLLVSQESQDTTNENFPTNIRPEDEIQPTEVLEHDEGLDNNAENMGGNEELVAEIETFNQEPTAESTFHQEAVVDVYEPNESYRQDSQYYNPGSQELAEPMEVNEHEETSSPYDQNYAQQYSNNYGQQEYPQQEFEQIPQAYETQEVGYDQNQGYEGQQTYGEGTYDPSAEYEQQQGYDEQQAQSAEYEQQQGYDEQQAQVYAQYNEGAYVQPEYQQEGSETVQHIEQQVSKEEGYPAENNEQLTNQISTEKEQKVSNQQQSQE